VVYVKFFGSNNIIERQYNRCELDYPRYSRNFSTLLSALALSFVSVFLKSFNHNVTKNQDNSEEYPIKFVSVDVAYFPKVMLSMPVYNNHNKIKQELVSTGVVLNLVCYLFV